MAKINLNNLSSLTSENSALNRINDNNDTIEVQSDTFLSRVGAEPNEMEATLDMNSNRIINLPAPIGDHEPVRRIDLLNHNGGIIPLPGVIPSDLVRYEIDEPDTFDRTLTDKLKETRSLLDFAPQGSIGNGQDATAAWMAAEESGYDIFVPAGTYLVSNSTVRTNGQKWYGEGLSTIIKPQGNVILFNYGASANRGGGIDNFFIDGTGLTAPDPLDPMAPFDTPTVWFSSGSNSVYIYRIVMVGGYNGIHIDNCNSSTIRSVAAFNLNGYGIRWFGNGAFPSPGMRRSDLLSCEDIIMSFSEWARDRVGSNSANGDDATGDEGLFMIMDGNVGTFNGRGLECVSARIGFYMRKTDPNVNVGPDFTAINGFSADFPGDHGVYLAAGTGCKFNNAYTHFSRRDSGIKIDAGFNHAMFHQFQVTGHFKSAYDINGTDITITDPFIHTNSFDGLATLSGKHPAILIRGSADRVQIAGGGHIGKHPTGLVSQSYGVHLLSGAKNVRIGHGVSFEGNMFAPYRDDSGGGSGNFQFGSGVPLGVARIQEVEISNVFGRGAVLSCTVNAGAINSVTVVNGGYGYTTPPTIVVQSLTGTGAILTPNIANGVIQSVTISNPGSGYATAPTLILFPAYAGSHIRSAGNSSSVNLNLIGKGEFAQVAIGTDKDPQIALIQPGSMTLDGTLISGPVSAAGPIASTGPHIVPGTPLASLYASFPPGTYTGGLVYVADGETGGAVIAFSDGTNWRRCTDRAIL